MQIANRESFAVAARRRLPYDAEVEWIQITNNTSLSASYIDTGLVADSSLSLVVSVLPVTLPGNPFMGAGRSSPDIKRFHMDFAPGQVDLYYGTNNTLYKVSNSAWTNPLRLEVSQSEHKFIVGSRSVSIPSSQFSTEQHFLLGLRYWNGNPQRLAVSTKFYSFRANNGSTEVDLMPVRANGLGYMYDRVSRVLFGNAGNNNAGFSVYGSDKTS